jgi:hypothetical protein
MPGCLPACPSVRPLSSTGEFWLFLRHGKSHNSPLGKIAPGTSPGKSHNSPLKAARRCKLARRCKAARTYKAARRSKAARRYKAARERTAHEGSPSARTTRTTPAAGQHHRRAPGRRVRTTTAGILKARTLHRARRQLRPSRECSPRVRGTSRDRCGRGGP